MADDRKQPLIRSLSRARFLGLLGFGAAGVLASRWVRDQLEGFRYNTVERPRPAFDPATYRLRVDGMVARPLDLTYDELLALPRVRQTSDFHCVEGWGVDDVRWEGLSLQSLMERVGPAEGARFITFHSMGGVYADSLTIEQASLASVLLAYHMYEQPLTPDHGAPLRLVMPRMYGYKGPKWVERVEFVGHRVVGYWEQRGWELDAWIA